MTPQDIERIAREAGVAYADNHGQLCPSICEDCDMGPELRKFAALVLEQAAKVCDGRESMDADWCAADIRTLAASLKDGG